MRIIIDFDGASSEPTLRIKLAVNHFGQPTLYYNDISVAGIDPISGAVVPDLISAEAARQLESVGVDCSHIIEPDRYIIRFIKRD